MPDTLPDTLPGILKRNENGQTRKKKGGIRFVNINSNKPLTIVGKAIPQTNIINVYNPATKRYKKVYNPNTETYNRTSIKPKRSNINNMEHRKAFNTQYNTLKNSINRLRKKYGKKGTPQFNKKGFIEAKIAFLRTLSEERSRKAYGRGLSHERNQEMNAKNTNNNSNASDPKSP